MADGQVDCELGRKCLRLLEKGFGMLCQKCWNEEARVHFCRVHGGEVHWLSYCLACAQDEPFSWVLAWGNGPDAPVGDHLPVPVTIRAESAALWRGRGFATLVATQVQRCDCGCRVIVAATMPCTHGSYAFGTSFRTVDHECHCGREHTILVPDVICTECGAKDALSVVGTAETCSWEEQRRRLVGVHDDLQRGRATWGTFAILN